MSSFSSDSSKEQVANTHLIGDDTKHMRNQNRLNRDLQWFSYHGSKEQIPSNRYELHLPSTIVNIHKYGRSPLPFSAFLKIQNLSQQQQFSEELQKESFLDLNMVVYPRSVVLTAAFASYRAYCRAYVNAMYPSFFKQSHDKRWFCSSFGPTAMPRFNELAAKFIESLSTKSRATSATAFLRWLSPSSYLSATMQPALHDASSRHTAPTHGSWLLLLNIPLNSTYFEVKSLAMRSGGFQKLILLPVHQLTLSHSAYVCFSTPGERDAAISMLHLTQVSLSSRDGGSVLRTGPSQSHTTGKPSKTFLSSTLFALPWNGTHHTHYTPGVNPPSPVGIKQWHIGPISLDKWKARDGRDQQQALALARHLDRYHSTPKGGIDTILNFIDEHPVKTQYPDLIDVYKFQLTVRYLRDVYLFDYFTMTQYPSAFHLAGAIGEEWRFIREPTDHSHLEAHSHPSPAVVFTDHLLHLQQAFNLPAEQFQTLQYFEAIIAMQPGYSFSTSFSSFWEELDLKYTKLQSYIETLSSTAATSSPIVLAPLGYTNPRSPLFSSHCYTMSPFFKAMLSNMFLVLHYSRQRSKQRYQCQACQKIMISPQKLLFHVQNHHQDIVSPQIDGLIDSVNLFLRYLGSYPEGPAVQADAPFLFLSMIGSHDYFRSLLQTQGMNVEFASDRRIAQNEKRESLFLDSVDADWHDHKQSASRIYTEYSSSLESNTPHPIFLQSERTNNTLHSKRLLTRKSSDSTKDAPLVVSTRYADGDRYENDMIPIIQSEEWLIPANYDGAPIDHDNSSPSVSELLPILVENHDRRITNYSNVCRLPTLYTPTLDLFSGM